MKKFLKNIFSYKKVFEKIFWSELELLKNLPIFRYFPKENFSSEDFLNKFLTLRISERTF